MQSPLAPDYYRENFETVIDDVRVRYAGMLGEDEVAFIASYGLMGVSARRLFVRLLTRKGPWIRGDSLNYAEILDCGAALSEGVAYGLLADDLGATLADFLNVMRRDELVNVAGQLVLDRRWNGCKRDELIDWLLAHGGDKALGLCRKIVALVRPLHVERIRFFLFLFFGNFEQDLTDFVIQQVGNVKYECYPISTTHRVVESREAALALWGLQTARETLEEELVDLVDSAQRRAHLLSCAERLLGESFPDHARVLRRYSKFLTRVGRELERCGENAWACKCYSAAQEPPARERIVRICAGEQRLEEAVGLAMSMCLTPKDASEVRFSQGFLRRSAKHSPTACAWTRDHPQQESLPVCEVELPRVASVEQAVLEWGEKRGFCGFFAENLFWGALFGLVFWDIIFSDQPGAFVHRYQRAPLDIGSSAFFERRQDLFSARFRQCEEREELREIIARFADEKRGIANVFVNWEWYSQIPFLDALANLSHTGVLEVLRRMVTNPLKFDSGFPDLFVFGSSGKGEFWEVKGPGDQVRPEQDVWMRFFAAVGIPAQVVRVKWV